MRSKRAWKAAKIAIPIGITGILMLAFVGRGFAWTHLLNNYDSNPNDYTCGYNSSSPASIGPSQTMSARPSTLALTHRYRIWVLPITTRPSRLTTRLATGMLSKGRLIPTSTTAPILAVSTPFTTRPPISQTPIRMR
jgi:hypothetical protein